MIICRKKKNNNDKHHAAHHRPVAHHRRLRRLRGAMADGAGVAVVCGVVYGDNRMITTDQEKIKKALNIAVKAIYFADNSDYETALYQIVAALDCDETADLLAIDSSVVVATYCPELAD